MTQIEKLNAIVDAFDAMDGPPASRRDAEGRTLEEALAHEMWQRPLDTLLELLGEDDEEQPPPPR